MIFALFLWGCTIVVSVVLTVLVCRYIERTGVKRWGATGKLFKYE